MHKNDTWVKLFRELRGHPIIRDSTAFHIFGWVLICVNYKTGKMFSGRFWASEELGTKPRTFHKALKRLEKKYDLVTLTSDNKKTTITVKNWHKYRSSGDTSGDNKVTTKGQQSDTKQEYKNIRIKKNTMEFINYFNNKTKRDGKSRFRVTDKKKKKLRARLKTYTMVELKTAVDNFVKWKFYLENKGANWVTPEYLLRNDDQVERFLLAKREKTGDEKIKSLLEE